MHNPSELAELSAALQALTDRIRSRGYDLRAAWQDEYGDVQAVTGVIVSIVNLNIHSDIHAS